MRALPQPQRRALAAWAAIASALACQPGCAGLQSALDPAGVEASRVAQLFFWMAAGTLVIWSGVMLLALSAPRFPALRPGRQRQLFIVGAGVLFPLAVLTPLLAYGLAGIPPMLTPGEPGLTLEVTGHQWWWRVRYVRPGSRRVELANEIRLPVDRRVTIRLTTRDVIHSFWMPTIAGKMDMIPGRRNELAVQPTQVGTFRGACAEFCGMAHARMNFSVVVMPQDEFDAWLARQEADAGPPADTSAQRGQEVFFARGCHTCHTVRGTPAVGVVGPDLTHVGSRLTIAAGQFPADRAHIQRWIRGSELMKPGVRMPAFTNIPDDDLAALAAYVAGLE